MVSPRDRVVLAAIARPHGLEGGLRLKVFNPDTEMLAKGRKLTLTPEGSETSRVVTVRAVQPEKETWIVSFAEIRTRSEAESLRGAELSVTRDELPDLDDGDYYHSDLVGCRVRDEHNEPMGEVVEVIAYPTVDAIVVKSSAGSIEVPMVGVIVVSVDVTSREIVIDRTMLPG